MIEIGLPFDLKPSLLRIFMNFAIIKVYSLE
jgi:hypothetical protein